MKLSSKLSIFVLGVILPVIIFFYLINARLVLSEATKFETALGVKEGQRIKDQIAKQIEAVRTSSKDWGGWNEVYYFVQEKNNNFLKNNLIDPLVDLGALRSDFIFIINTEGKVIYSAAGNFNEKKVIPVPEFITNEFIDITKIFFHNYSKDKNVSEGFFLHDEGAVLFSSNKILHSDYSGEPKGLIFLGRFLDERLTQSFKDVLQGNLEFVNLINPSQMQKFSEVVQKIKSTDVFVDLREKNVDIYLKVPDYKGGLHLLAHAQQDRYMSGIVNHILKNEAILWLLVALLLIVLFVIGNRYLVINKIKYFTGIFDKVKGRHDLTLRAHEKWGDEFASLAEGFNHMMSSLLQKQQQLVHSSKMASIGILTSGVAHEINNSLFIAKGYIQILLRKMKKDEHLKLYEESLIQADTALIRIEEIVRTLQQYSKGSENVHEVIYLNNVIEDALVVSKSRMGKVGIEVKTEIPTNERFEIEGAFSSVQQIIINVLVNAIEALELVPEGQRFLNIRLSKQGNQILLSVIDSGPGINPEIMSKIYDPFFTTKEVGKGIGLGLFTVHSFILHLGGEIHCESELGKGTCFKIYFPGIEPIQS